MRDWVAIYMATVGVLMIGLWAMLLLRRQVPELVTEPWRIVLHIVAEILCALALLSAAMMVWLDHAQAAYWSAVALGMLLYTIIASTGFYLQRREWPPVAFFGMLFVATIFALL